MKTFLQGRIQQRVAHSASTILVEFQEVVQVQTPEPSSPLVCCTKSQVRINKEYIFGSRGFGCVPCLVSEGTDGFAVTYLAVSGFT